ncbi:cupin domain-containing protein [Rubripirellula reticaptiva]|uniref:Cupin domain protein n=1 Tax=Rubripirellula reticaptiva TaxID=2528013 RepID=A0A5C6F626_9BACT|nr:cupin domain-containing protein [Rubripirellula reticaptiva]TWU55289.1 Cupin domain protein [Rubripirellula reticaptiva]
MKMHGDNLSRSLPDSVSVELTEALVTGKHVRIERIVSQGHQSPDGFWYDQSDDEWVAVIQGEATIEFDDETETSRLGPGDWINIPAHKRHRVAWTSPNEPTIWLAVFSSPDV